jgi:hypothetical protein
MDCGTAEPHNTADGMQIPQTYRRDRVAAFKKLEAGFSIGTHQRTVWVWIQVESDDFAWFLNEEQIGTNPGVAIPISLYAKNRQTTLRVPWRPIQH